jgi:hypothetical protein
MSAHATILDAFADPQLFGGQLEGTSWEPWRVFLKALYALPMTEADISTYQHHTGRQTAPKKPQRYSELVVGRRGGKSRILGLIAAYMAALIDHSAHLVPGENPVIAIIAADRKQAQVIFRYVSGALRASPLLADLIEDELNETLKLSNGVMIEIHTGSVGAPRGRTFLAVLADECAFWQNGDAANPDIEIINAVRPGLASIPYSLLLIASSPYAKKGLLYQNYARYFGKEDAPVLVWQGSTQEMNVSLADDPLIAEMYEEDPERASAEFGAQFRSDIVAFITREAVEEVLARGVWELPPGAGVPYVAHVDPSGGSADSMTLAIAHLNSQGIAVLDAIREIKPPFSPDAVVEEFAALLKTYQITKVVGDAYAGEWPRERFAVHGIRYEVSTRNTSTIYQEFLPALNGLRVQLLDIPRLTGQLVGLERRTARGGRDSIAHAPGSHDDVANAACGALVQLLNDHRPNIINPAGLVPEVANDDLRHCQLIYATLWVGMDGIAAYAIFAFSSIAPVQLLILDFDKRPWAFELLDEIAEKLDTACERVACERQVDRAVHVFFFPQEGIIDAALMAMRRVFVPRLASNPVMHRQIKVNAIDAGMLADPTKLLLIVSRIVSSGKVKFSTAASEKTGGVPVLGALEVQAGTNIDDDPLRVCLLTGIAAAMEVQSSFALPPPTAATLRLG